MAKDEVKAEAKTVEVELLHPITHNDTVFSRGIHKLDEETAKLFLSFKDAVSRKPIVRVPEVVAAPKGTVEQVPKGSGEKEKK
jgi:hypothetical protein